MATSFQDDYIKTALRLPRDLHALLMQASKEQGKSFNSELIERLRLSFAAPIGEQAGASTDAGLIERAIAKNSLRERLYNLTFELGREVDLGNALYLHSSHLLVEHEDGQEVDVEMEAVSRQLLVQAVKVDGLRKALAGVYQEMDDMRVWYVWDSGNEAGSVLVETMSRPKLNWPPEWPELYWAESVIANYLSEVATREKKSARSKKTARRNSKN